MAIRRNNIASSESSSRSRKPDTTPEGRESKMVSLAERLAERQLRDGTASSQVLVHYLKLGSSRERKEQAKLEGEIVLQEARVKALGSTERLEKLYESAMTAFRGYQGQPPETEDDNS